MTQYGRTYTPPIFHTEKASKAQKRVMEVVFDTLRKSGIDFCIVQRDTENKDELVINSFGDFTLKEKSEILTEVVEMCIQDKAINHVSME